MPRLLNGLLHAFAITANTWMAPYAATVLHIVEYVRIRVDVSNAWSRGFYRLVVVQMELMNWQVVVKFAHFSA